MLHRCVFLALTASVAHGQIESGAPCSNTMPSNDACCYEDKATPVMGGIDFVDLAGKTQGQDGGVSTLSCWQLFSQMFNTRVSFVPRYSGRPNTRKPWVATCFISFPQKMRFVSFIIFFKSKVDISTDRSTECAFMSKTNSLRQWHTKALSMQRYVMSRVEYVFFRPLEVRASLGRLLILGGACAKNELTSLCPRKWESGRVTLFFCVNLACPVIHEQVSAEAENHSGKWLPPADVVDPVWIRFESKWKLLHILFF